MKFLNRNAAFLISACLLCSACKGKQSTPTAEGQPATHAPESAKPGSHEDWCGEHQVPESMCTRCNPALVPAFKATGDWCAQHALPESQCLACNPKLKIERPAKSEAAPR